MTQHGLRRHRFAKGPLLASPVGLDKGQDPRIPCPVDERPTDESAQRHGFKDAQEWYTYSAGGALVSPSSVASNFSKLSEKSGVAEGPSPEIQWWSHLHSADDSTEASAKDRVLDSESLIGEAADDPSRLADRVSVLSDRFQCLHPYLLSNVEPYAREKVYDIREKVFEACRKEWIKEARGAPGANALLPLPVPP